ncbi:hypothetical protein [Arthrobacter sp. ES1]|uniref:hypothetical protein n=1 Tax=Arthrobacter sp. ES1 TaxID=1897056 RepID=UPI001D000CC0|nr:hypothetical protein [Arthrobacter sp. ES1]MCB5280307.1 hypothetical protein [Arthrobacter sp. ES1]
MDPSEAHRPAPVRAFGEIRKDYVVSRIENLRRNTMRFNGRGNWRQAAKDDAHQEFNAFVHAERAKAAQDARLAGLAEGWDQGWLHRGNHADPDSDEYGKNPYRELIRERQRAELEGI